MQPRLVLMAAIALCGRRWTCVRTDGWQVLLAVLGQLRDGDLTKTVRIRGQALAVHEALHRSLAHASYHVGQIVYVARAICGANWRYLSIPPGGSAAYNANPQCEKATAHAGALGREPAA
jgi:uncharacterized protein DUF1572